MRTGMKRTLVFLGWAMLVGLVLSAVLVIAAVTVAGGMDHATIQYNGEPMRLAELDTGHWLVAIGCIALTLLVLVLVVPFAVLIPLAIAAVALFGALIAIAGVMAIVFSPLIMLGLGLWLVVRLLRRSSARNAALVQPTGGATITG
ncbi:MAG: hypothetical protein H7Y61_10415 [Rhizobiales bacterium]|nr:hypothetical protein [Rhizobacter sp.]